MAQDTITKVVRIETNYADAVKGIEEYTRALEEVKEAEQDVKDQFERGEITVEQRNKSLIALKETEKEYKRGIRELSKEIQNNIKQESEKEGSMRSLRAELSNLTKEYDSLSRQEREGAKGRELQDHINQVTDEIKRAEEQTQRYYRNVGNYSGSLIDVFGKSGGAVSSMINPIKNVTAGFKAMSATPVIAILGLLAQIINKVIEALHGSETSMNAVKQALAPLNAGTTLLTNVFQKLGEGIAWVVEKLTKYADKLGLISSAMKEEQRLVKEEIALNNDRRDALMKDADDELAIAQLKEKATDKLNYTHAQRLEFLKQATDAEDTLAKRRVDLAKREYQLLLDRSKLSENSAEDNQKLAEAYAKMVQEETAYFSKKKELNAQITEATNQAREERRKAVEIELKEIAAAADARIALIKDENKRALEEERVRYGRQIQDLQTRLNTEKNLTQKAREAILRQIEIAEAAHKQRLAQLDEQEFERKYQSVQKEIALRLETVQAGTEQEYDLKLQQLQNEEYAELRNAELTAEQKQLIRDKYEKQRADLDAEYTNLAIQRTRDALQLEYENKIAELAIQGQNTLALEVEMKQKELETLQQMEGESDAAFKARQLAAEQEYLDRKKAFAAYEVEITTTKMDAISSVTGSLSDLFEELGEENEGFAKFAKVLALAEIAINTGKAIAAGTAQAMSVPFPANIAAIATTVATVLANITSAIKTVKSAKVPSASGFSRGGTVSGPGSGTSDSVPANLSNGESVNTALSTSLFAPLYSALNQLGGGVPITAANTANQIAGEEMLSRAVARGVASLNLRIGVDEIQRVSSRAKTVETLGDV